MRIMGGLEGGIRSAQVSDRGDRCSFGFKFSCCLYSNVFPYPPIKPKLSGDVPMNRQNAAARRIFFFLFCNVHCLLTHRIILRHQAMRGEQRKKNPRNKIWKLQTLQIWTPLPIGAGCIIASIYCRSTSIPILSSSADFFHSLWRQQFAAFCLFVRTLPIDFALLGRKRKYIKSKMTAKLREKRASIATIRDIL